jgi:hypothetical protein
MGGCIPPLILYVFLACVGITFTFAVLDNSFLICVVIPCFLHFCIKAYLSMGGFV